MKSEENKPFLYDLSKIDLKKYEAQGVDISLITANLRRTPTERAEKNKAMLRFIEEARKARARTTHA